jgi:hypothetical protein
VLSATAPLPSGGMRSEAAPSDIRSLGSSPQHLYHEQNLSMMDITHLSLTTERDVRAALTAAGTTPNSNPAPALTTMSTRACRLLKILRKDHCSNRPERTQLHAQGCSRIPEPTGAVGSALARANPEDLEQCPSNCPITSNGGLRPVPMVAALAGRPSWTGRRLG